MAEGKLQNLNGDGEDAHKSKLQKLKRMGKIRDGDSLGLGDVAFSGSSSFSSLPQSMHSLISLAILSDRILIPWQFNLSNLDQ